MMNTLIIGQFKILTRIRLRNCFYRIQPRFLTLFYDFKAVISTSRSSYYLPGIIDGVILIVFILEQIYVASEVVFVCSLFIFDEKFLFIHIPTPLKQSILKSYVPISTMIVHKTTPVLCAQCFIYWNKVLQQQNPLLTC